MLDQISELTATLADVDGHSEHLKEVLVKAGVVIHDTANL